MRKISVGLLILALIATAGCSDKDTTASSQAVADNNTLVKKLNFLTLELKKNFIFIYAVKPGEPATLSVFQNWSDERLVNVRQMLKDYLVVSERFIDRTSETRNNARGRATIEKNQQIALQCQTGARAYLVTVEQRIADNVKNKALEYSAKQTDVQERFTELGKLETQYLLAFEKLREHQPVIEGGTKGRSAPAMRFDLLAKSVDAMTLDQVDQALLDVNNVIQSYNEILDKIEPARIATLGLDDSPQRADYLTQLGEYEARMKSDNFLALRESAFSVRDKLASRQRTVTE